MNKDVKERVEELLVNQIDTRDNDNLLISLIWIREGAPLDTNSFLIKYSNGGFTSAETIRRTRQLLQADNENLRGEKYNERQRKGEEVRQTINK